MALNRKIAPPIHNAMDFDFQLPYVNKYVFNNGIPAYWISAGTQDVIQIQWVFEAGLWEESQRGIAKTTAVQLKSGTVSKSAQAINEALEFYGVSLKSSAGNDYSVISLNCLTKHLSKVLPIIQEIIFSPSFPERELEIYLKRMINNLSINLKKVDFVANRESDAQVFGYEHPYGRFSQKEDIENVHQHSLLDFHHKYYQSGNCRIFMAGNINDYHLSEVAHFFGQGPWGTNPGSIEFKTFEKQPAKGFQKKVIIGGNNVQGAIRLVRPFPTIEDPDSAPMSILNTVLGGYFGSRLMSNIREDKGYTYGIYSSVDNYKRAAAITISTEAAKEFCEDTIKEIHHELIRLQNERISESELKLVKNYLFGGLLASLDGPFRLIRQWKGLVLNGYDQDYFYRILDIYRQVTPEQLQELAQKYLDPNSFYHILVV